MIPDVSAAVCERMLDPRYQLFVVKSSSLSLTAEAVEKLTTLYDLIMPHIKANRALVGILASSAHLQMFVPISAQTKIGARIMSVTTPTWSPRCYDKILDVLFTLHNDCSSGWLYFCEFLDTNSIVYGLRRVNRRLHYDSCLSDGSWWQRQLKQRYAELDDAILNSDCLSILQQQMVRRRRRQYASDSRQAQLMQEMDRVLKTYSIFYTAAIHVETRLSRFSQDVFQQQIPQLVEQNDAVVGLEQSIEQVRLGLKRAVMSSLKNLNYRDDQTPN